MGRDAFPARPQRFDRPPPVAVADSNGAAEYGIERVLAERKRGRRKEYLVAWRGYPPEENTWEPRNAVRDTEALQRFVEQQRAAAPED